MVFLFVADHIHHLINREVLETQFGCADILRHINGCAIRTEEQFLVQSVFGEVRPNRTVFAAVELTGSQTFLHFGFALEVSLRFVINLVKANAHHAIGLIKTGINPAVHFLPESPHFGVVLFPFKQHGLCFLHKRCLAFGGIFVLAGSHQFGHLFAVFLVKTHIVIADEVVAFLAGRLGRLAIAELQPCEHGFADMYAAVVDDVRLHHFPAVGLLDLRNRPAKQVIADVTEVQRFVGVWRTILHHHQLVAVGLLSEMRISSNRLQLLEPVVIGD